MNVKYSRCMNRCPLIFAALLLLSLSGSAQNYRKVIARNFWNDGDNVAGIRQDSLSRSYAEAYGGYVTGGYRASFEAVSAWHAGLRASTVTHLKKFSMIGSFGFRQMEGEGMAGSMFTKPGFYPFNIHEFTQGHKTMQTYDFKGGISIDLSQHWRIGGVVEFESSNYSKRKDLRHTNYRLDLNVVPAVQYRSGKFAAGLAYIYSRNTETVNAEQVGSTVESYEVFFDKGLYYGVSEIWTGSGAHLKEAGVNGFPVRENIHGAAIQFSYADAYADFRWRSRLGEAGEKECIWYRFPGWDISAHLGYKFRSARGSHNFRIRFNYLDQDNYETVLDKVTTGGVTTVVQYGSNLIFNRKVLDASLIYKFVASKWEFSGNLSLADSDGQVTTMYPYVARQHLIMPSVEAGATRHIGGFDLGLTLMWGQGAMTDGVSSVSETSGVQTSLERLDRYFIKYKEHMTSYKLAVAPSLRYNFSKGFYAEVSARWLQGFEIQYLSGNYRVSAALKFGYNF